jgi:cardiolipin synthase
MAFATDGGGPDARPGAKRDDELVLSRSPVNLPNLITAARLLLIGPLMWLIVTDRVQAAFWVFIVAGVSDAVDGYIAKTFNAKTDLGAILDPLADKMLLDGIYVALALGGNLPLWLALLVVSRDLIIVVGVIMIRKRDPIYRIRPLVIGKLNTFCQIVLAATALAIWGGIADVGMLLMPLVILVTATTLLSGASYALQAVRHAELERLS